MGRANIIDILYTKNKSSLEFSFENLRARPLLSLISIDDIYQLNKIATSVRLSSKPKTKYQMIDSILVPKGFKKLASGTNRVAYKYLEDQSIILKVAIDKVGISDNPREYQNQFLLQPFVTKVFEVSPCGTVGLFERVVPITSSEEYLSVAEDVFAMITTQIIGKYVVDDIGSKYFQNIGVRPGMGVVLLDFPYVYELDGNKLFCNKKDPFNHVCGGEIDYDSGFNKLVCTKCGKRYFAHQLRSFTEEKKIITKKEGEKAMNISIKKGNTVLRQIKGENTSDTLPVIKKEKNEMSHINIIRPKKVTVPEPSKELETDMNEIRETVLDTDSMYQQEQELECNKNISVENYRNNVPKDIFSSNESSKETVSLDIKEDIEEVDDIELYRENDIEISATDDVSDNY